MRFLISLLTAALVGSAAVYATPVVNCPLNRISLPQECLQNSADPNTPLPPPTGTLAKIILGVGTQNYSCTNGVATPNGAEAVLYDVSCLAEPDLAVIKLLPAFILHAKEDAAAKGFRLLQQALNAQIIAGSHLFEGDFSTPVFKFNKDKTRFVGKVGGKVPALPNSDRGKLPDAYGAVPSLKLLPKDAVKPNNYKEVYRLYTAGGSPPASCNWTGQKEIPYAAQYWFYV